MLRILELVKTDPHPRDLIPDPDVDDALKAPDLPLEGVIATALDGYSSRAAFGERHYRVKAHENGRCARE